MKKRKTVKEIQAAAAAIERDRCAQFIDSAAEVCRESGDSTGYAALLFVVTQIRARSKRLAS